MKKKKYFELIAISLILAGMLLSLLFAWVSSGFKQVSDWSSFWVVLLVCSGILAAFWKAFKIENPPQALAYLLIGAWILRFITGMIWFTTLPILGHGTPAEKAGYVMADAGSRDQAAWSLAKSEKPLWTAFRGNRKVDQYGGMLFISALVYRYLGSNVHQPLMMVMITAAVSSLAVLFTWAFARRAWNEKIAWLSVWILLLYPEAVLLGSSQMREAFFIVLVSAAFYGLVRFREKHDLTGICWGLVPLLLLIPFSPPFAALVTVLLLIAGLIAGTGLLKTRISQPLFWLGLTALSFVILVSLYFALKQFTPARIWNPIEMVAWWLRKSAHLQAFMSENASGWMQKIFDSSPQWTHFPMLLVYGIVQPFLPAALVAGSYAPLWKWIAIWRSIGWTLALAFLVYTPFLAVRIKQNRRITMAIITVVWIVMIIAAVRGGSDQWDNPRYRAAFAGLACAIIGWTWIEHLRVGDPWLRRAFLSVAAILIWFLPWYLRRYYSLEWTVIDPMRILGLGLATASLVVIWDWVSTQKNICLPS